jgi:RNA 2',3'-cyclic 3'-phosphodiesterase
MRLFVGIPLAQAVIEELTAVCLRLQEKKDDLRWSSPTSWHITLQFLGNTTEYECIVARLRELRAPQVRIQMEGLGFFERAGVFFAGVALPDGLKTLQQRVAETTSGCGFVPETRPYHPHVTLARTKRKGAQSLHALRNKIHREPKPLHFLAGEFVLYESLMGAGGSRYEIRERFALESASPATT